MIKVDADTVLSASDFTACALTFAYTRDCALTCTRAKELTAVSFVPYSRLTSLDLDLVKHGQ